LLVYNSTYGLDEVGSTRLRLDYRLATHHFFDEPAAESGEGIVPGALFTLLEGKPLTNMYGVGPYKTEIVLINMAAANAFQSDGDCST
jgi:hypothetical protein